MCIEAYKRRAGLGYRYVNGFGLLIVLFKTVIPLRN